MRVLYFAWLRERLGLASEELTLPATLQTPREVIAWLRQRSLRHDEAFADDALLRCAVNQSFCGLDERFDNVTEIAFFPPVTGG